MKRLLSALLVAFTIFGLIPKVLTFSAGPDAVVDCTFNSPGEENYFNYGSNAVSVENGALHIQNAAPGGWFSVFEFNGASFNLPSNSDYTVMLKYKSPGAISRYQLSYEYDSEGYDRWWTANGVVEASGRNDSFNGFSWAMDDNGWITVLAKVHDEISNPGLGSVKLYQAWDPAGPMNFVLDEFAIFAGEKTLADFGLTAPTAATLPLVYDFSDSVQAKNFDTGSNTATVENGALRIKNDNPGGWATVLKFNAAQKLLPVNQDYTIRMKYRSNKSASRYQFQYNTILTDEGYDRWWSASGVVEDHGRNDDGANRLLWAKDDAGWITVLGQFHANADYSMLLSIGLLQAFEEGAMDITIDEFAVYSGMKELSDFGLTAPTAATLPLVYDFSDSSQMKNFDTGSNTATVENGSLNIKNDNPGGWATVLKFNAAQNLLPVNQDYTIRLKYRSNKSASRYQLQYNTILTDEGYDRWWTANGIVEDHGRNDDGANKLLWAKDDAGWVTVLGQFHANADNSMLLSIGLLQAFEEGAMDITIDEFAVYTGMKELSDFGLTAPTAASLPLVYDFSNPSQLKDFDTGSNTATVENGTLSVQNSNPGGWATVLKFTAEQKLLMGNQDYTVRIKYRSNKSASRYQLLYNTILANEGYDRWWTANGVVEEYGRNDDGANKLLWAKDQDGWITVLGQFHADSDKGALSSICLLQAFEEGEMDVTIDEFAVYTGVKSLSDFGLAAPTAEVLPVVYDFSSSSQAKNFDTGSNTATVENGSLRIKNNNPGGWATVLKFNAEQKLLPGNQDYTVRIKYRSNTSASRFQLQYNTILADEGYDRWWTANGVVEEYGRNDNGAKKLLWAMDKDGWITVLGQFHADSDKGALSSIRLLQAFDEGKMDAAIDEFAVYSGLKGLSDFGLTAPAAATLPLVYNFSNSSQKTNFDTGSNTATIESGSLRIKNTNPGGWATVLKFNAEQKLLMGNQDYTVRIKYRSNTSASRFQMEYNTILGMEGYDRWWTANGVVEENGRNDNRAKKLLWAMDKDGWITVLGQFHADSDKGALSSIRLLQAFDEGKIDVTIDEFAVYSGLKGLSDFGLTAPVAATLPLVYNFSNSSQAASFDTGSNTATISNGSLCVKNSKPGDWATVFKFKAEQKLLPVNKDYTIRLKYRSNGPASRFQLEYNTILGMEGYDRWWTVTGLNEEMGRNDDVKGYEFTRKNGWTTVLVRLHVDADKGALSSIRLLQAYGEGAINVEIDEFAIYNGTLTMADFGLTVAKPGKLPVILDFNDPLEANLIWPDKNTKTVNKGILNVHRENTEDWATAFILDTASFGLPTGTDYTVVIKYKSASKTPMYQLVCNTSTKGGDLFEGFDRWFVNNPKSIDSVRHDHINNKDVPVSTLDYADSDGWSYAACHFDISASGKSFWLLFQTCADQMGLPLDVSVDSIGIYHGAVTLNSLGIKNTASSSEESKNSSQSETSQSGTSSAISENTSKNSSIIMSNNDSTNTNDGAKTKISVTILIVSVAAILLLLIAAVTVILLKRKQGTPKSE